MEGGSLNSAAERLHRTQPQVSRLLSALEAEVGFRLFDRKTRRLVPTKEAREFYADVERALHALESAAQAAQRVRERQHRHVRILTSPHVTDALLADPIATMVAEYPGFSASISSRSRVDIELWLGREQFDIGITVLPLSSDEIEVEPMVTVRAVAVMRDDHPLAGRDAIRLPDLFELPLVANAPRTVMRQRLEALFREAGREPKIRLETPNGQIACELAARGLGLAVADGFVARSSLKPAMVMRPFEPAIELAYVLIFPRWQARTAAVDRLASLIRAAALRQTEAPLPSGGAPEAAR